MPVSRTTPLAAASLPLAAAFACAALAACARVAPSPADRTTHPSEVRSATPEPGERHLANIRQLTNGGENAEAYFSRDGRRLIFQSTRDGRTCDQQYTMNVDGTGLRRVSTGTGKTTCGYFYANDRRILWGSTHGVDTACPPRPDPSKGYVWRLDPFDIWTARADGSDVRRLTNYGVYTAEATLSPDGRTIVFTSLKDGDLEIYTMNVDGSNVRRLTHTPGYDGGPFFSPDGKRIVYRSWHPTDSVLAADQALLAQRLVRPSRMEIWVMNADGSDQRQVTELGGANFAPFFTPDGRRIIFSSNYRNPRSRNFDLYLVDASATRAGAAQVEQVTTHPDFDGFPMFSPDGRHLVWGSNRQQAKPGETNIFIAEWRD
jgi:Tol biopolymer transport system component